MESQRADLLELEHSRRERFATQFKAHTRDFCEVLEQLEVQTVALEKVL